MLTPMVSKTNKLAIILLFLFNLNICNCQLTDENIFDYIMDTASNNNDVDNVDVEEDCYCVDNSQCSTPSFLDSITPKSRSCSRDTLTCCQVSDITCRCTEQINCADEFQNEDGHCTGLQICCSNIRPQVPDRPSTIPTPPQDETICGTKSLIRRKTTGGQLADETEYPWFVAVLDKTGAYSFAGSLIHPQAILTVAHRVDNISPADISIKVGSANIQSTSNQRRGVRDIILDPKFNRRNLQNNVAILILDSPLEITLGFSTICLPSNGITYDETKCISGGWGKDETDPLSVSGTNLRYVRIPVVDHATCQSVLQNTRLSSRFRLHESFICAGGEGADTCIGDGGSPLVCPMLNDPNRFVQLGITAWGIDCGVNGVPGVYSSTEYVMTWATRTLGQEFGRDVYKYFRP